MQEHAGRRAPGPIVVGVDGSQGSARALAWALREARDRRTAVRVITVWAWGGPGTAGREACQNQEALVRAVVARFPGALPQLTTELVQGDAATALIERSKDGDLLVLGSCGLGGTACAAVGTVARACLRHGNCPVVVVPAEPATSIDAGGRPSDGRRTGLAPVTQGAVGLL